MTPRSPVRHLARLLTVVSLVMSGVYMFVYLYRWEWNRALIAGVFFLGAEIALATSLILARLPAAGATSAPPLPPAPNRAAPEPESRPFAWLTPLARGEGFGVFVPVLLGAGVVLSTLAFAVERLAAVATRGRRSASGSPPAELRLASGGYLHRPVTPAATPGRRSARPAGLAAIGVVVLAGTALSLDQLGDLTQARPDPRQPGATTLVVEAERRSGPSLSAAVHLWDRCRTLLPANLRITTATGPRSEITVKVGTVLGPLAEKKLRGCLEDASLPGIRGSVVSLERSPRAPEGSRKIPLA